VTNSGDPIYNTLLLDTIYNEAGDAIHEQRWSLETIAKDETIIVRYTAFFSASTTPGTYTNKASISASTEKALSSEPVKSPTASFPVTVSAYTEALTAETAVCEPLLTSYLRYNTANDTAQVSKLQMFLRTRENDTTVPLSGIFDRATFDAVHTFQQKYASDVLEPWGMARSTGYVYFTTQKKVNELWCGKEFPLSADQTREIATIKTTVQNAQESGTPLPEEVFETIGSAPAIKEENTAIAATEALRSAIEGDATVATEERRSEAEGQLAATAGVWASIRERVSSVFSFFK
ncbi:MAG: hypothetical protein KBD21_04880, partial [Candidatus Pacebacteria bacterium]|nr:hypothetical protein [Candidatus Paceibacterota bacterium]